MMSLDTVQIYRRHLCKQEGVTNRRELATKLGSTHQQPLNQAERAAHRHQRVQQLLLEGLTNDEICQREGMKRDALLYHIQQIYRKHGLKKGEARPALGKKFGIELTRSGRKQMSNDATPKPMKAS